MGFEEATPCRHRGAPSDDLVDLVVNFLTTNIRENEKILNDSGLSKDEFDIAFPAAIERIRGSWAAANSNRRRFADTFIQFLASSDQIKKYIPPKYGEDTVHRLELSSGETIGLIQKGCPDGAHSSTRWTRPDWADELYLWWICSSKKHHPGEHVWKGVSRVRKKIATEPENQLDGVIFFNEQCGTHERPCPKQKRVQLGEQQMPPPCVFVFPKWTEEQEINWRGEIQKVFPNILLQAFGLESSEAFNHIGYIGFKKSADSIRTEITSRFGPGKRTSSRG